MTTTRTPNAEWSRRWAQEDGDHWVAEADRYDELNSRSGAELMKAVALKAGERVLDVGCGNGATTLEAAERVRPGGSVVGIDVSAPMLAVARERARSWNVTNVDFIEADAQVHPFAPRSFDVVISRNGLMYFDEPTAAFINLARSLRHGGRLAFTAPQGLHRNEWIMAAGAVAAPILGPPKGVTPGQPGPVGLADPDRTYSIMEAAGFVNITVQDVTVPMRIGTDVDDAFAFILSIPFVRELFDTASPEQQEQATLAVRKALEKHVTPEGVVTNNNGVWLVTARRENSRSGAS
jgi:SAM-dependent methyltransferase